MARTKRMTAEQARAEEEEREEREYRARQAQFEAERGYRLMHREPFTPPMNLCLRCSVLVFDRDIHDRWHESMGQDWRP